ncbi:MAG: hypothetical protein ACI94Y_004529 [Maribacter sp.]|jgi:hypothetical protein
MKNLFQIIGIAAISLALLIPQSSYGQVKVGDNYQGGIVFYVNGAGQEGLVCQTNDLGSMDWANAVSLCDRLGDGWRLPTKAELNLMYTNLHNRGRGNFVNEYYWSSSDNNDRTNVWDQDFSNGVPNFGEKVGYLEYVRAVRTFTKKAPVSAELSLQSGIQSGANGRNRIPLNRNDPAYTVDGLDINPAIYVYVTFSDGSTIGPHDYQTDYSDNLIIDDTSGDPNDLIKVSWWDKDSNNPSLGKYAAQLTSTGKGVGSAYLKMSLRDAPHVTASVLVEVVSSAKVPVSADLGLQSGIQTGANGRNRLPLNRNDPAYTVEGLSIITAIYLDVQFSDGTSIDFPNYQREYADNIIFDDTSRDPNDIIKIIWWDRDSNNPSLGKYAAQLTSTGKGVGSAYLKMSLRDAPHVTASVLVEVVSSAKPALAAPRLNSPADKKIFTHFPRETTLIWGAVTGAMEYIVELDCHFSNNTWHTDTSDEPFRLETTSDTFYSFGWVGAQAGRWRITAVDKNGNEGKASEWRQFEYTQ